MRIPDFRELLGDPVHFFAEHHNRGPVLRRGALTGDPREILSIADIDEILASEAIRPPYLDIAKDGKQVLRSTYTEPIVIQGETVVDRVVPERVAALFRSGATLTFNALNHHRPNLRVLSREAAEMFAARSETVAFLTPAGRRGLAPHTDPVDVYVLQLEGTKAWKVWPFPDPRPGTDGGPVKEDTLGKPAVDATLEPGDLLYIPSNSPHVAAAEERVSLHLTITVEVRHWSNLLRDVVDRIVREDPAFWDTPLLRPTPSTAADLEKAASVLAERLRELDFPAEVKRLIANGEGTHGFAAPRLLSEVTAADHLDSDTLITVRAPDAARIVGSSGDKVQLSVDGAVYAVPKDVGAALEALADGTPVPAKAFIPGTAERRSVETARKLIRMGALRAVAPFSSSA